MATGKRPAAATLLVAAVAAAWPANAVAAREDTQSWPTLFVTGPIGATGFVASFEDINRVTNDVDRLGQLELRFQAGHRVTSSTVLWLGYVRVVTYNPGARNGHEDQAVEQLNWNPGAIGPVVIASRTRLEQRFQRGVHEANWRLREQLRLTLPLREGGPALTAWAEPFVELNHTRAIHYDFDQLRLFAGIDVPLAKHVDVEAGYLAQFLNRPPGDLVNHVVPVVVSFRF